MSATTVARTDFRSIRRSYVVVGVVAVLAVIVALVFTGSSEVHPHPYRTLYGFAALVVWVFPLLAAPLAYLAIAGDRVRGSIKYYLGLPNSRAGYFAAKYVSRASVAVVAMLLAVAVGYVVAAATYQHGPDPVRFLTFGVLSTLFALAMVGIFVAISAATATRSRAMMGVLGTYFVLCVFWVPGFVPVLDIQTVLDAVASATGLTLSESTRSLVDSFSPGGAYFGSTQLFWSDVADQYEVLAPLQDQPDYLGAQAWFNVLVMIAWIVLAPLVGFLRFRRAELS